MGAEQGQGWARRIWALVGKNGGTVATVVEGLHSFGAYAYWKPLWERVGCEEREQRRTNKRQRSKDHADLLSVAPLPISQKKTSKLSSGGGGSSYSFSQWHLLQYLLVLPHLTGLVKPHLSFELGR